MILPDRGWLLLWAACLTLLVQWVGYLVQIPTLARLILWVPIIGTIIFMWFQGS